MNKILMTPNNGNIPWLLGEIHPRMREVLHFGKEIIWEKNTVVHEPGRFFQAVYFLLDGLLSVSAVKKDGKRHPLWIMCPGNLLGENALLLRKPSQRYIETLKECRVVEFSREILCEKIIPEFPEIGLAIMENMAIKSYISMHRFEEMYLPLNVRIAMFLYICTCENCQDRSPSMILTKVLLVEVFKVKMAAISLVLNKLAKEGVLDIQDQEITVLNRNALEKYAFKKLN